MTKNNPYIPIKCNTLEYHASWDDIHLIEKALTINENDVVLTITSSGCNVLNILLNKPKKIISVDYNSCQNFLLELKLKGIKHLTYPEFIELIGIIPSKKRLMYYHMLKQHFTDDARCFWDSNFELIENGITYYNEQDLKALGYLMRFLKGNETLEKYFKCTAENEQTNFFFQHLYGFPWLLFHTLQSSKLCVMMGYCLRMIIESIFMNRPVRKFFRIMQRIYIPRSHKEKINHVFTKIPIHTNSYASLLLLNRYVTEDCFPPYLKHDNFSFLQQQINRIFFYTDNLKDYLKKLPDNSITKLNLSNIFDWITDEEFNEYIREILRVGVNGARFCYFSARDDRSIPIDIKGINSDAVLANQLLKLDRTLFYGRFEIGFISK